MGYYIKLLKAVSAGNKLQEKVLDQIVKFYDSKVIETPDQAHSRIEKEVLSFNENYPRCKPLIVKRQNGEDGTIYLYIRTADPLSKFHFTIILYPITGTIYENQSI